MMGVTLEVEKQSTYLGVEFTTDLSWSPQIDKVTKKANGALHFIRRNLAGSPKQVKEMAYKSMVRPILEYSSTVWDPYQKNDIHKLEMVQRRAARFVTGNYDYEDTSVTKMIEDLGWRTLQERRFMARQTMFLKIHQQSSAIKIPPYIFPITSYNRGHQKQQHYQQIRANSDTYLYSFFPRTIRCWNILPSTIINEDNNQYSAFSSALRENFKSGSIVMTNPRDLYTKPRLSSHNTTQNPVYVF